MAFVTLDRVKVTSSTTGTGTLTLGSATDGFQDFSGVGDGNQTYYAITGGTDWEVGIGTYTASGTTLSRDQVFASSNSGALVNLGAGDKEVFIPFPAEGTQGSSATGDNSSIGTDLTTWNNFKKILQKSINGGTTFKNNNVTGVISTYSLVYTAANKYIGGVLATNGDVHFVPLSADRGQKVSALGVVSTYSLVYTRSNAYVGGVLAANGDVHFIPSSAEVGQKISASGVVSTYSLVNTAGGYGFGVLAPNGDIHFGTGSATVGQKVSAAGVVSTYSLVYTTTAAYAGNILAPNGDIHMVPNFAAVGQKISAAGVVSTYSLVYTTSAGNAYYGGVLDSKGDIYFIPGQSTTLVGQKVNGFTGVVSTYALVYTPARSCYGGVLAPNGEIHFLPFSSNAVGEKISVNGVISTYSWLYDASLGFQGGVLNTNDELHLVPRNAVVGQKITFCSAIPFPPEVCLSSFMVKK